VGTGSSSVGAVVLTGNYPSEWATPELLQGLSGKFVVLIDTLQGSLLDAANVVLPGATFAEKAGTFENWKGVLQAFHQAIPTQDLAKAEAQIGLDLLGVMQGAFTNRERSSVLVQRTLGQVAAPIGKAYDAGLTRAAMAQSNPALGVFVTTVAVPDAREEKSSAMEMVTL
jgi:NADH dehydrogenase/NADH:ubiquinone oxidoreductase subunit G